MREILFRAKRADSGTWIEGNYLKDEKIAYISGFIYNDTIFGFEKIPFKCQVIPETVSQFTGLYDQNGVRIWENDIVRFTRTPSWLYQVIWDKESAMFGLKCVKSPSLYNKEACGTNFYDIDSRDVEIVGNVFNNPELLKEK